MDISRRDNSPSGCGKSTLLHLMAGLDEPSSGQILLDGVRIRGPGPDGGVVFQNYVLMPWLTALENVIFAIETAHPGTSKGHAKEQAREYLSMVDLDKAMGRYPREMSGGMKQRVAIARALSIKPKILLMDEPFGALDAQINDLIDLPRIRPRKRIMIETHPDFLAVKQRLENHLLKETRAIEEK